MSRKILAQRCLSWMAAEEELGDLEEMFGAAVREQGAAAAEARYVRESAAICLSILRRQISRGGENMVRLFLWATVSVFLILWFLHLGGGEASVYLQPFEWGVILSAMLGFGLAGRRLGAWRAILSDLRRADRLMLSARRERRSDYVSRLRQGLDETPPEFAHMGRVALIARQAGTADANRLMAGGIAQFKESCRQKVGVVQQTAVDAYVGSAIAMLLGFIHLLGNLEEPIFVLGHLLGGALCAPFFGMILGRAVLIPMAGRLSGLYEQEVREMEAFRLVADDQGAVDFSLDAFEVLA